MFLNETHAKRHTAKQIKNRIMFSIWFLLQKKIIYDDDVAEPISKTKRWSQSKTKHRNEHGRVEICRFFSFFLGLKVENNPRNAIVTFYGYSFCLCLCVIFTLNVHLNLENVVNTVTKFTNEVLLLSKWMKAKQFRHCVCLCVLFANTFALIYCVYPPSYVPTEWTWFVCLFLLCATYHFHFISYNWIVIILLLLLLVRFSQNSSI